MPDLSGPSSTQTRELREQLDRASLSALLNTAEGNGRRQGRQRAKFFDDARGSAIECAACLDVSVAKGFALLERIQPGKEMLVRVVAMLTKLVERFDPYQYRVRQSAQALTEPLEDEDDASVASLWRALARGWPRRRPCEVGTSTRRFIPTLIPITSSKSVKSAEICGSISEFRFNLGCWESPRGIPLRPTGSSLRY